MAVSTRITLEGADELRRQFEELGRASERAFKQIAEEISRIGDIKLPTDEAKKNLTDLGAASKETFKGIEDDAKNTKVEIPAIDQNKKAFEDLANASKESFKEIEQAATDTKVDVPVEKPKSGFADLATVAKAAFGDIQARAEVAKGAIDNLTSGFSGLQKALLGLGAVGGVLAFIVNRARNAANTINEMADAAEKNRTSIDTFNQLDFMLRRMGFTAQESKKALEEFGAKTKEAAKEVEQGWGTRKGFPGIFEFGGEVRELRPGIIHISEETARANRELEEMQRKSGETAAALEKVRETGKALFEAGRTGAENLPQLLIEYGKALEALPSKQERVAQAQIVLGEAFGKKFVEDLDTKGLEAAVERFQKLSLLLGKSAQEAAKEWKDALDGLKRAKDEFDFVSKIADAQKGIVFAPVLTKVFEEATKALEGLTLLMRTNSGEIQKWATDLGVTAVKAASDFLKVLLGAKDEDVETKWLIGPTKALKDFLKLLAGAADTEIDTKWLLDFRDTVIEAFRGMATAVTEFLLPTFKGLGEAIQPFLDSINQTLGTSLTPALVGLAALATSLVGPFTALGVVLAGVFFAPGKEMDAFREKLKGIGIDIQGIKEFASQAFDDLKKALSGEKVDREWINTIAQGIKDLPQLILGVVAAFALLRAGAAGLSVVLRTVFGVQISGGAILIAGALGQLTGILPAVATAFVALAAASTVAFNALRSIILLVGTVGGTFAAAAIAIGAVVIAFTSWETITTIVSGVFQTIITIIGEVGRAFAGLAQLIGSIAEVFKENFVAIGIAIAGFIAALALIPGALGGLGQALAPLGAVLVAAAARFWGLVAPILAAVAALEIFNNMFGKPKESTEAALRQAKEMDELEKQLKRGEITVEQFEEKLKSVKLAAGDTGNETTGVFKKISDAWEEMIRKMTGGADKLKGTMEGVTGNIRRRGTGGNILDIFPVPAETKKVEDAVKEVTRTIDEFFRRADEAGKRKAFGDVFELFEKGIKPPPVDPVLEFFRKLQDGAKNADDKIGEFFKNILKNFSLISSAGAAELPGGPGGGAGAGGGGPFAALAASADEAFKKTEASAVEAFRRIEEAARALGLKLAEIFRTANDQIGQSFQNMASNVAGILESLLSSVSSVLERLDINIKASLDRTTEVVASLTTQIKDFADEMKRALEQAFEDASTAITQTLENLQAKFKEFADKAIAEIQRILDKLKELPVEVGGKGGGGPAEERSPGGPKILRPPAVPEENPPGVRDRRPIIRERFPLEVPAEVDPSKVGELIQGLVQFASLIGGANDELENVNTELQGFQRVAQAFGGLDPEEAAEAAERLKKWNEFMKSLPPGLTDEEREQRAAEWMQFGAKGDLFDTLQELQNEIGRQFREMFDKWLGEWQSDLPKPETESFELPDIGPAVDDARASLEKVREGLVKLASLGDAADIDVKEPPITQFPGQLERFKELFADVIDGVNILNREFARLAETGQQIDPRSIQIVENTISQIIQGFDALKDMSRRMLPSPEVTDRLERIPEILDELFQKLEALRAPIDRLNEAVPQQQRPPSQFDLRDLDEEFDPENIASKVRETLTRLASLGAAFDMGLLLDETGAGLAQFKNQWAVLNQSLNQWILDLQEIDRLMQERQRPTLTPAPAPGEAPQQPAPTLQIDTEAIAQLQNELSNFTNSLATTAGTVGQTNEALGQFDTGINGLNGAFQATIPGLDQLRATIDAFNAALARAASAVAPPAAAAPAVAGGGLLGGRGTGTSDSNLAWVSRGEYITPARAVRKPGVLAFLEALRWTGGDLKKVLAMLGGFASGGLVGLPRYQMGGAVEAGGGGGGRSQAQVSEIAQLVNAMLELISSTVTAIGAVTDRLADSTVDAVKKMMDAIEDTIKMNNAAQEGLGRIMQNLIDRGNAIGSKYGSRLDPSFAYGGLIGGRGSGTSDSNLAWVSRGEYITPAAAVRQPGVLLFLEALRRSGGNLRAVLDSMGRFAFGGLVPGRIPAIAGSAMANVTINFPGVPPISGLRASSSVVDEMRKAAVLAQVRSGGRKPSRYG